MQVLRIRRGKLLLPTKLAHLSLLVGADTQRRSRPSGAEQDKTSLTVVGKIAYRVRLIDVATIFQPSRAGQTASLMAERGQNNTGREGRVPDVTIATHLNGLLSFWKQENNPEHSWV